MDNLNAYLLKLSVEHKVEPSPGYAILGKMQLNGRFAKDNDGGFAFPAFNNKKTTMNIVTKMEDIYIYVLDEFGRLIRMETFSIG